jgi:hypothetical protein
MGERSFENLPPFDGVAWGALAGILAAGQRSERIIDLVDSKEVGLCTLGLQALDADLAVVVLDELEIGLGIPSGCRCDGRALRALGCEGLGDQGAQTGRIGECAAVFATQLLLEVL